MVQLVTLRTLQKRLEAEYQLFRANKISEKEYLRRAKPLDFAIGDFEMATLRDSLVLKESSSRYIQRQEN